MLCNIQPLSTTPKVYHKVQNKSIKKIEYFKVDKKNVDGRKVGIILDDMGKLSDIIQEKMARALVKHSGNYTEAYQDVYPDASPSSAKTSASALLSTHNHIKDRALELLANTKGLRLEDIIGGLKDDLSATKVVYFDPATKEKHLHADYASIHKARQFVFKLYGLGNDSINISQDNRSVTVNTGDPATVERLEGATSKLERLHAKLEAERKGKAV